MQQHHNTRQSHMRLPSHTNNIQIHPTPNLPGGQPPAQLQPQSKLPATVNCAQSNQNNTQQQPATSNATTNMRDQASNRSNNHKHISAATAMQQQLNQTTQMQKIRQQHQHLNHKNNANHNNNNINSKLQYGNHMNTQQQQNNAQHTHNIGTFHKQQHHQQTTSRNVPNAHVQQHHQQQQYNALPMKNHTTSSTALKQILPTNTTRPTNYHHQQHTHHQQMPHQQQQYGYAGNKPKYNINNNHSNAAKSAAVTFSTPKAILQNPNRLTKPTRTTSPPLSTTTRATNSEASVNSSKNAIENAFETTEIESNGSSDTEVSTTAATVTVDSASKNVNNESMLASTHKIDSTLQKSSSSTESNKENLAEPSDCDSNSKNNEVLCNDDSIAKNSKEKTPMCLVNELARFNKITHQYRLTGEKGPAHSKRFTVTLKLGDEEYTAEGFKIKKAQHAAASQALEKTAYKHPIPKAIRNHDDNKPRPYIMPTVELNALAMKLGQQTYYLYDPRQMPQTLNPTDMHEHSIHDGNIPTQHYGGSRGPPIPHNGTGGHLLPLPPAQQRLMTDTVTFGHGPRRHFDGGFCGASIPPPPPPAHMPNCPPQRAFGPNHRGGFPMMNRYQRYPMIPPTAPPSLPPGMPHMHHPHFGMLPTTPYKITLIVGKQKFVGSGRTLQHAKHDAASRALQVLKSQKIEESKEDMDDSMDENDIKSPISQVHEAAIKRNLTVHFKIIREDGPAHMRNFITACIMGSLVTEGEGHGKKISKKRAAEKMLVEIKKLPPPLVTTPTKTPTKRSTKGKTPSKSESKDYKDTGEQREMRGKREKLAGKERARKLHAEKMKTFENDEECPITKLLQLMQQRKQKEPVFEYIAKSGNDKLKKREFIVEVTAQGFAARGTGANKKIAKRNAAENLLHTFLESESSGSEHDVTEENVDIDEDATEQEASSNQSTPVRVKHSKRETTKMKSPKVLENIDLPTVSSTGQVPGILILRQSKKPTATKKTETTAENTTTTPTSSSIAARSVKANIKRIEVDSNETNATNIVDSKKENTKPKSKPTTTKIVVAETCIENDEKQQQHEAETVTVTTISSNLTNTDTNSTTTAVPNEKPTTSNNSNASSSTNSGSAPSMMKQQLLYLANLLGFEVSFSDYPKGNHNEFLTIVALNTDPPQMCHGFGQNTNESQNDAARNALKILSDLGLNNAKSN